MSEQWLSLDSWLEPSNNIKNYKIWWITTYIGSFECKVNSMSNNTFKINNIKIVQK